MKKLFASAAFAFVMGAVLSGQGMLAASAGQQVGPDLSGRWNREPVSGLGGADDPRWGPQVDIDQSGIGVRVRSASGKTDLYLLDGSETAEVLSVEGCKNLVRVTKATVDRTRLTITTWMVTKSGCVHGEFEDEPNVWRTGSIAVAEVRGTRKLESITVVSRDGDKLNVETTRANPGSAPTSSSTTYRK